MTLKSQDIKSFMMVKSIKGIEVEYSDTGGDCLGKLSKKRYDVMIIDLNLSDMDGLGLLKKLIKKIRHANNNGNNLW